MLMEQSEHWSYSSMRSTTWHKFWFSLLARVHHYGCLVKATSHYQLQGAWMGFSTFTLQLGPALSVPTTTNALPSLFCVTFHYQGEGAGCQQCCAVLAVALTKPQSPKDQAVYF